MADAHILLNLTAANDGQLHVKTYTKLDINFLGLKVLTIGFLILGEPYRVPDKTPDKTSRHYRLEFDMAHITGLCWEYGWEKI